MRSVRRWRSRLAVLGLLVLGACTPRTIPPPVPPGALPLPRAEPEVRVGLVVDAPRVELASTAGFQLVDAGTGETLMRVRAGTRLWVEADAAGDLLFGPAGEPVLPGVSASPLVARPLRGGLVLVGEKPYHGAVLVRSAGPGRVTAVNQVDLETYLLGVVPHEIGRVGPELLEAAKAQAIAARTYAIAHRGRRSGLGFDYYATVQDQVYGGSASEHDVTSRAVRATEGQILTHRGVPIEAYYHSTCAGQTAAIEEVWDSPPRPYLISVVDVDRRGVPYDTSSSRFRWTERWSVAQLTEILNRTLRDSLPAGADGIGELRDLHVVERTRSGRVGELRIETTAGTFTVGGDRVRWILRTPEGPILNSSKFDVRTIRNATGEITEIVAEGGGWGHGIGMCQVGAMGRDRAGQDYRTILDAYYPGTELRDLY